MANQISLFGAVVVNGYQLVNPEQFFQDVSPKDIVTVELTIIVNGSGTSVPAFKIVYNNRQGLTQDTYFLGTHNGLTTLANFKSGLAAVSADNKFTIYTDLIRTSNWASSMVPASYSMLINDAYTTRIYMTNGNQTQVNVTQVNSLSKLQCYFQGDQTLAGTYYYFYSWGE